MYSFFNLVLHPTFASFLGWFRSAHPYKLSPNSLRTLLIFLNLNSARQSTTKDISWCEKTKCIRLSDDKWFMSTKYHSCSDYELSKTTGFKSYCFVFYGEVSLLHTCYHCVHKNIVIMMYFWENWIIKVCCKLLESKINLEKIIHTLKKFLSFYSTHPTINSSPVKFSDSFGF